MTSRSSLLSVDSDGFHVGCDAFGDGLLDRTRIEVFDSDGGADVEEIIVNGELGCEGGEDEELGC